MEKYINDFGKECYRGVDENTRMSDLEFHLVVEGMEYSLSEYGDTQHVLHTNLGTLTVLDRRTGFGHRDVETGFRSTDGRFWLASGNYDVMDSGSDTISDAIEWVKEHANNCIGV